MAVPGTTDFTGTNGAAWPSPWTQNGGTSSIQTNRGRQVTPTGVWVASENKANVSLANCSIVTVLNFTASTNVSQRINLRWNSSTGNGYRLIMTPSYNGLQLMKVTGFTETVIQEIFTTAWTAGTDYSVRFEVNGSTVRARRWLTSESEPTTWDVSGTDTTYTTGDVALVTVVMDAVPAGTSVQGMWDDVVVTDLGSGGGGGTPPTRTGARVGFHNDAFLAPFEDYGTYTTFTDQNATDTRAYTAAQVALGVPMLGESAAANGTVSQFPNAGTELATYRWSCLNPNYHPDVLASWTQAQKDDVARRLGYRLRLTAGTVPTSVSGGGTVAVSFTITNDGYAATYRARQAQIVFVNGGTVVTRTLAFDVRTVGPGQSVVVNESVSAPSGAGTYSMHLMFPDLLLPTRPEYAIQLANIGVWDATTGRNSLGASIVVSGLVSGGFGSTPFGSTPFGSDGLSVSLNAVCTLTANGVVSAAGTLINLIVGKTITVGVALTARGAATLTSSSTLSVNGTVGTSTSQLGKTTNGAASSISSGNKTVVSKHTASGSGLVTAGHSRLWVDTGTASVEMAVYADSGGTVGALLGLSDTVTISNTAEAQIDFTFSGAQQASITVGTDYWIGFTWADPGTNSITWSRDGTTGAAQQSNVHAGNPFGTATASSGPIDAYVDVSSGGSSSGITNRTATKNELSSSTSIQGFIPSGTLPGEFMLVVYSLTDPAGLLAPSGWTSLFTPIDNAGACMAAFFRRFVAGDADPTLSWTTAGRCAAVVQTYPGVHTATPLDVTAVTVNQGGAINSPLSLTIDPVSTDTRLVSAVAMDGNNTTGQTITTPSGMTLVARTDNISGQIGRYLHVADEQYASSAGATRSWTQSPAALTMSGFIAALRPA